MSVTATLTSRPARALGAALLVAGLAGGLLAGAAASAAALQSPATAAAGPDPAQESATRRQGRRPAPGCPLHRAVQVLGSRVLHQRR